MSHTPLSFLTRPSTLRGMLFMLLSALASAGMNGSVRHISGSLDPFEIAFFRVFFGLLVFAPLLVQGGIGRLRTKRLRLHALRGGLQAVAMLQFFTGLSLTPLAKAAALQFNIPLFSTLLAFVVLHETIRLRRVSALIIGFAGTVIILRPDIGGVDLGSILVVTAAATWASAIIVIKLLSRTDSSVTITIYGTLFMLPFTLMAALPYWQVPTLEQLAWLVAIGALASTHNLFVAQALRDAEVSVVMPFDFTKLIWSAIIGYLFFAEVPTVWTWIGGFTIFASATYITYSESRFKKGSSVQDAAANRREG
ncbi:MAG: DMT family transporter [Rhodospirillales bacterium]|nr:DMT family transporter [Rhodospirillales bacterium]